jgi:hypothetical protein
MAGAPGALGSLVIFNSAGSIGSHSSAVLFLHGKTARHTTTTRKIGRALFHITGLSLPLALRSSPIQLAEAKTLRSDHLIQRAILLFSL